MKKKILNLNQKLISYFGIPPRSKKTPGVLDALIATILSQNTNDKNSYKAFEILKARYKNWEEVSDLSAKKIANEIRIAGLANQKSRSIKAVLNSFIKNGQPDKINFNSLNNDSVIDFLTAHEGVGIKTASCVLLFSLGRNICPVDTHVHRTLNRIGIVKTSSPDKTFFAIKDFIPENTAHTLHTNLILLGREFCKPQKPLCFNCPVRKMCKYESKNLEKPRQISSNKFLLLDSIS
jgi:endonuclease-3